MELESLILFAFFIGLLSAFSLPLGALTTLLWTPSERAIAWLMAFGAGALLSAVTIDLFAPAIDNGQFFHIALGAILGSLFYLTLNHQLNQQGGFLRKTATTIQYFRNQQKHHHQQLEQSLDRLTLFNDLPDEDQQNLFQKLKVKQFKANNIIFHPGDTPNEFYIIQKGNVKLRDPKHDLRTIAELKEYDSFGHMAFLCGLPNSVLAQANGDVTLWVLQRSDFNALLNSSPVLFDRLLDYFNSSEEVELYLQRHHSMSDENHISHLKFITEILSTEHRLPYAREPREIFEKAINRLQTARRLELLEHCEPEYQSVFASKLKLKTLQAGETLFAHKSEADRLYLLESGHIDLIDPQKRSTRHEQLSAGDFFGGMAFLLGGQHISTAIATTDIEYWILEKSDFEELLNQIPKLYQKLQAYLKANCVHQYLTNEQKLSETKAQKWVKHSVKHLVAGSLPSLASVNQQVHQHQAAYFAIMLGIFLDGIPESFMIGSHLADGHMISISLIAAIFISNYPEALSSSASMREQGISFKKIFWAWTSLMILTGMGAALGSALLSGSSDATFALISGMAAGAMLTVIAETMLPEAYAKGGSVIGFVTLIGFLSAILFKVFDSTI